MATSGVVYRARDTELDRVVAVKILQPAHRTRPHRWTASSARHAPSRS